MRAQTMTAAGDHRIVAGLPFVEALARRMAASMPNSIDLGDLVQDGVLGLIDAANRFDEARGIKFETFAERRIRGAMIDALRKDAWPRGVRRQRRALADLAQRVGSDEKRLSRTIVRINTIESTSPLASGEHVDEGALPAALVPSEPDAPDSAYEKIETRERIQAAIQSLPCREQKVIGLYYYAEATMKQIGAEIGVNESRVSQLHARAIRRLRDALGQLGPRQLVAIRRALVAFTARPAMLKAALPSPQHETLASPHAVVLPYRMPPRPQPSASRTDRSRSAERKGLASQRQPLALKKRSASVPATSPVTKMTRLVIAGARVASAR
jgi:RNA polymerase sigma factor FliA